MTSADDRRTFGRVVRSLRERAGRTRPEFARACNTAESHLRNIENGHKSPGTVLLRDLEQQLGTHGLLGDLATCGENGVRRRIILQSLALMGASIPDDATASGTLGSPQLEVVRSMTTALRGLDSSHGGAHANHSIVAYLQNVALPMLNQPLHTRVRAGLLSSVAELALLAGWSAFDAGVQGSARAYFGQALELANDAANAPLACETIIATSNQSAIIGDATAAVESGEAALAAATEIGDHALIGEARMALAHGQALTGDATVVARLITQAQQDLDRADRPDGPEWIQHVGHAWLDGRIAQCLHLVGDRPNAAAAAEQTAANARPLPRGNVLNLGHTALVMFAAGRPEEAAAYAGRALESAALVQSARVEEYMMRLEVAAAPYRSVEAVAELHDALASR
ncbi:helix-turn-helix domain-containing protein [Glycomyces tarimensis]